MTPDARLTWTLHGFRMRLLGADPGSPLRALVALYALCAPVAAAALLDPALAPLLATLLLPLPTALVWCLVRPRETVIELDPQRLVVHGPLGGRRSIPLRAIRQVGLRLDGLDIELHRGRVSIDAPTSVPQLAWIAARLSELTAEVRALEADVDRRRGEVAVVLAIAHVARDRG